MNPVVIRKGMRLGELAAEADEALLQTCFIDNGVFERLTDVSDTASVVVGRTGAGKSALILHAANTLEGSTIISPDDVSVRYLEHSNIIEFLNALGVRLDIFYRHLWRHIIIVELLKLRYKVKSTRETRGVLQKFVRGFDRNSPKRKALDYIEEWGERFWLEADEQLKEITSRLSDDVRAGLGAEFGHIGFSLRAAQSLDSSERVEITSRANRVVNEIQMRRLSELIELLADHVFDDPQKRYYLLIDKLDEDWADTDTRCRFIRALIEEIKFFRRIPQVKIIVAIRDDLLELVYDTTRDAGFQAEKYEAYEIRIQWSESELRQMLDKRVSEVFKRQYTGGLVCFEDVFPASKKGGGQTSFDYMVERTLRRPRDLLQFANECLLVAHGRDRVSWRAIKAAEAAYSKKRLKSLCEEWGQIYPSLEHTLEALRGLSSPFTRSVVSASRTFEEATLVLFEQENGDPCVTASKRHFSKTGGTLGDVLNSILQCLYRAGVIGIKISSLDTYIWSFLDQARITAAESKRASSIRIHKMLHQVLEVRAPLDSASRRPD